jgi:hypothetical protein
VSTYRRHLVRAAEHALGALIWACVRWGYLIPIALASWLGYALLWGATFLEPATLPWAR